MLSWMRVALLQPRELREQLFRVAVSGLLEELRALSWVGKRPEAKLARGLIYILPLFLD